LEFESRNDAGKAVDLPVGEDDGVTAGVECGLSLPEPVGIAPPIAEFERIDDRLWQFDPREVAVAEHDLSRWSAMMRK
jgi:hypothetical protein